MRHRMVLFETPIRFEHPELCTPPLGTCLKSSFVGLLSKPGTRTAPYQCHLRSVLGLSLNTRTKKTDIRRSLDELHPLISNRYTMLKALSRKLAE